MEESTVITLQAEGITDAITKLKEANEKKHAPAIRILTRMRNAMRKHAIEAAEREYAARRDRALAEQHERKKRLKGKSLTRAVRVDQILQRAHERTWAKEREDAEKNETQETRATRTDLTDRDYDPETERGRTLGNMQKSAAAMEARRGFTD